jgi:phosphomannomutase
MKNRQLIASTSGIRGVVGNGLDPVTITSYAAAFGTLLKRGKVVLGSDTRPSGEMVRNAAISGLISVGIDVIDIGVVPTPTVEIAVKEMKAAGGICITASHNSAEWNALKFFNSAGEFVTPGQFKRLSAIHQSSRFEYQPVDKLGRVSQQDNWVDRHVRKTLAVKIIDRRAIKKRRFKVVVDAINGAGSHALPQLLERLGAKVICINCKGNGDFVHNPEPTPKNLSQLAAAVRKHRAALGMACDPDADRLALVNEQGEAISEEYTLTIAVSEVLSKTRGPTVLNLSTSRATADVARSLGSRVYLSKVGESNVVQMMHQKKAVIGGEGNGGVIFPSFHAGRDSLIGAALVLSALARSGKPISELVGSFPTYYTVKGKASLPDNFTARLTSFEQEASGLIGRTKTDRRDGLRFDFAEGWLQVRSSNTEPIFRLIVETDDAKRTNFLYKEVINYFK